MVASKTKPKNEEPVAEPTAVDGDAFNQEVAQTAESLIKQCSKVKVRISWFGTSAKVDDDTARGMLSGTHAEKGAVAISKRLLSCKHRSLEAAKAARNAIDAHVAAWTVPMLAIKDAGTDSGDNSFRKDAGVRLIQKKDMEEFDQRLTYLKGVLTEAVEGMQRALPEIIEEEKTRLGTLFREADYPKDVRELVSVEATYEPTGIDLDWQELCPEIYQREAAAAKMRFQAVVENAAVEWANAFVGYVKQVVEQLGCRTRVNPVAEFRQYNDAEVVETRTHANDPEVEKGMIEVKLRLNKGKRAGKSDEIWLDAMPEDDYRTKLRPYEAAKERKKLYASTIDNLKTEMDKFLNIGPLLGPYASLVEESVEKVKGLLGQASSSLNSEDIAKQLREGDFFRNQMKNTLVDVAKLVNSNLKDANTKRRSIRTELIGEV